jgi:hypothetical protein
LESSEDYIQLNTFAFFLNYTILSGLFGHCPQSRFIDNLLHTLPAIKRLQAFAGAGRTGVVE